MAKYDFDQLIPRRGTNSVKWDEEPAADILPMWVADMDFRTAPCVVEALRRRVEHGVYDARGRRATTGRSRPGLPGGTAGRPERTGYFP